MLEDDFKKILSLYKKSWANDQQQLIPLLKEVQEKYGCISRQQQKEIVDELGVSLSLISTFIKRIPGLKEDPCKCQITVCLGPRCSNKKSLQLLKFLEDDLKISAGETTDDHKFSLSVSGCMKNCVTSPNVKINDEILTAVTIEKLREVLKLYR